MKHNVLHRAVLWVTHRDSKPDCPTYIVPVDSISNCMGRFVDIHYYKPMSTLQPNVPNCISLLSFVLRVNICTKQLTEDPLVKKKKKGLLLKGLFNFHYLSVKMSKSPPGAICSMNAKTSTRPVLNKLSVFCHHYTVPSVSSSLGYLTHQTTIT